MDDPVHPTDPSHPVPAQTEEGQPPAAAYFSLVDALEALEYDHPHCQGIRRPHPVVLTFLDIRDYRRATAWTDLPTCLTREMNMRGSVLVGFFVPGVNGPADLECPDTAEELDS